MMKKLTKETISEFEVEDFIQLLKLEKFDVAIVKRKIDCLSLVEEEKSKTLQRLSYAVDRLNRSLSLQEIVIFILFPLGQIIRFQKTTLFNVKKERELGYLNRVKQFYLVSFIGYLLYFMIISAIIFSQR